MSRNPKMPDAGKRNRRQTGEAEVRAVPTVPTRQFKVRAPREAATELPTPVASFTI